MSLEHGSISEIVGKGIHTLQSYAAAWWHDDAARKEGWEIHYAVDADVVRMYLNPDKMPSYGRVFGETAEISTYLANLLSDHLFQLHVVESAEPASSSSYLIIPPHDEELRAIMQAIARDAEQTLSQGRNVYHKLTLIFSSFSKTSDAILAAEFQNSTAEFIRLSKQLKDLLSAQDRFSRIGVGVLENIWNERGRDSKYLIDQTEIELWSALHGDRSLWYERLRKHRQPRREKDFERWDTVDNDAQVLALIDHLNHRLADKKTAIILLTGSPSLFLAGREYVPDRKLNARGGSFADLYLRHPQFVMADPRFFDPIRNAASLEQWLEILSPDATVQRKGSVQWIEKKEMSKIQAQWSDLVTLLATTKYGTMSVVETAGRSAVDAPIESLAHLVESRALTPERFSALFERPVTVSLSNLYLSSTWIGLLDSAANTDRPSRMMPALRFDEEFAIFNKYYNKLLDLLEEKGELESRKDRIVSLKSLNDEINSEKVDATLYHSHIIHAAGFAAKCFWEPAMTLCTIAIRIADELRRDCPDDFRRGREAAYLAAVIRRRSAAKIGDLRSAEQFLREARKRENPPTLGCSPKEDMRFRSEQVAIEVRKLYFSYFLGETISSGEDILTEIRNKVHELEEIVHATRGYGLGTSHDAQDKAISAWVLRQSYTNLFDLLLILLNEGDLQIKDERNVRLCREFQSTIQAEDRHRDPHAWLVCEISKIMVSPESGGRRTTQCSEIASYIEAIVPFNRYDVGRKKMFSELIADICRSADCA